MQFFELLFLNRTSKCRKLHNIANSVIIFENLKDDENIFQLSTNLCPVHRTQMLQQIKRCLAENQPCHVISISLIEAGVDLDSRVGLRQELSCDVMTPSAVRGILKAIYRHPPIKYEIEKISAQNVRDFIKSKKGEIYMATSEVRAQRAAMILKDVNYIIGTRANFSPNSNFVKRFNR